MITTVPDIRAVSVDRLHEVLGLAQPCRLPAGSLNKPLHSWRMEEDDASVLRYLYQMLRPRRHLEFGTWQGAGTLLCLQNCQATVWTINLLNGEQAADGNWAYYTDLVDSTAAPHWSASRTIRSGKTLYQTDALGFVGRLIHQHGLGHRVCQIYCDSTQWDCTAYPPDFFDTVLIDGGHSPEVVACDTRKAFSVLRPGGVAIWHDYCPDQRVMETCTSVQGVMTGIDTIKDWLQQQCQALFWVQSSWLLLGVKR